MNPIEAAVAPMKAEAVARQVAMAEEMLNKAYKILEENGFNMDVTAPLPKTTIGRGPYKEAMARRDYFRSITTYNKNAPSRRKGEPELRFPCEEAKARVLKMAEEMAASSYDAYVAKLCGKVGECLTAEVDGKLWNYSYLTVTKADGSKEMWKTQMIVNVSSLGKLFNQWPTRKMKQGTAK